MSTDLLDWVGSLQRAVARPGEFATFFPNTLPADLLENLLDGFGQAQLDGFLVTPTMYEADDSGIVIPTLTRPQASLVVLYSARQFLQAELTNRKNRTTYEARGNRAETEQSASILTTLLKAAEDRLKDLRDRQRLVGNASAFMMADLYLIRAIGQPSAQSIALAGEFAADAAWDPAVYNGSG